MGTDCVAWYLPGMAPAGLETLGLCSAHPDVPDGGWTGHHLDHLLADFGR